MAKEFLLCIFISMGVQSFMSNSIPNVGISQKAIFSALYYPD